RSVGHASACAPDDCPRLRPGRPITPSTGASRATLKMRPGYVDSPTKSTYVGPGVMQSELGAPIACLRRSPVGVGPLTGRDVGSGGTSIENMRLKLPSVSNTWMRWFVRSPTSEDSSGRE